MPSRTGHSAIATCQKAPHAPLPGRVALAAAGRTLRWRSGAVIAWPAAHSLCAPTLARISPGGAGGVGKQVRPLWLRLQESLARQLSPHEQPWPSIAIWAAIGAGGWQLGPGLPLPGAGRRGGQGSGGWHRRPRGSGPCPPCDAGWAPRLSSTVRACGAAARPTEPPECETPAGAGPDVQPERAPRSAYPLHRPASEMVNYVCTRPIAIDFRSAGSLPGSAAPRTRGFLPRSCIARSSGTWLASCTPSPGTPSRLRRGW